MLFLPLSMLVPASFPLCAVICNAPNKPSFFNHFFFSLFYVYKLQFTMPGFPLYNFWWTSNLLLPPCWLLQEEEIVQPLLSFLVGIVFGFLGMHFARTPTSSSPANCNCEVLQIKVLEIIKLLKPIKLFLILVLSQK